MAATMETIRKIKRDMFDPYPFIYMINKELYFIARGIFRKCLPTERHLFESFESEFHKIEHAIGKIKSRKEKHDSILADYMKNRDNFAKISELLEEIHQCEAGSNDWPVINSKECELEELLFQLNEAELQNIQKQIQRHRDASEYANRYELLGKLQ